LNDCGEFQRAPFASVFVVSVTDILCNVLNDGKGANILAQVPGFAANVNRGLACEIDLSRTLSAELTICS
jgi:hypothetical protein